MSAFVRLPAGATPVSAWFSGLHGGRPEAVAGRVREIQEAVFASPATVYPLLVWDGAALAVGLTADERLRELVRRGSRPTRQNAVREQRQPLVTGEAALLA
jgi:hypothetical protein